jgi:hypothetical protein
MPGRAIGLAGLAEFLTDAFEATGEERFIRDRELPLRGIELFAIERPDGVAFAGERLQRLSCDYATGNAGIVVTLHRSLYGGAGDLMLDDVLLPPPVARAEEQFA